MYYICKKRFGSSYRNSLIYLYIYIYKQQIRFVYYDHLKLCCLCTGNDTVEIEGYYGTSEKICRVMTLLSWWVSGGGGYQQRTEWGGGSRSADKT